MITTGPVRAVLRAANHAPKLGTSWSYSVTVTDAADHPLSGTVDIEFAFGGQVGGHDHLAAAVGQRLTFRAVVHTSAGSVTLDWPIVVAR